MASSNGKRGNCLSISIFSGTFHWNELRVPRDFQPNLRFSFSSKLPTRQLSLAHGRFFALDTRIGFTLLSHLYVYSNLSVITLVLSLNSLVQNLQRKWAQAAGATNQHFYDKKPTILNLTYLKQHFGEEETCPDE